MKERSSTSDICDAFGGQVRVPKSEFRHFGKRTVFEGNVTTVSVETDNKEVVNVLKEQGKGRVLVVSARDKCFSAIVGDRLAKIAVDNSWAGLVIDGAVRDIDELGCFDIGVMAKSVFPVRGEQTGGGVVGGILDIDGVEVSSGDYCYADRDGVIFCDSEVDLPANEPVFTS